MQVTYVPPSFAGTTCYTVTGTCLDTSGLPTYGAAVDCVDAVICAYGTPGGPPTGVVSYELRVAGSDAVYFDLLGNRVERRLNAVLIEQRGNRRRKVCVISEEGQ